MLKEAKALQKFSICLGEFFILFSRTSRKFLCALRYITSYHPRGVLHISSGLLIAHKQISWHLREAFENFPVKLHILHIITLKALEKLLSELPNLPLCYAGGYCGIFTWICYTLVSFVRKLFKFSLFWGSPTYHPAEHLKISLCITLDHLLSVWGRQRIIVHFISKFSSVRWSFCTFLWIVD